MVSIVLTSESTLISEQLNFMTHVVKISLMRKIFTVAESFFWGNETATTSVQVIC